MRGFQLIVPLFCLLPAVTAFPQSSGLQPPDAPPAQQEAAEEVQYTLLKPDDKTAEKVLPEERNPFATGNKNNITVKAEGEENEIRKRLEGLRVVGSVRGKNGAINVMLGDIVLETGRILPHLLPEQTLDLQVKEIKEDSIELLWVEKKVSGLPPRILTLPMDLRANVKYVMQGQVSAKKPRKGKEGEEDKEVAKMGVMKPESEERGASKDGVIGNNSQGKSLDGMDFIHKTWNQAMNRENSPPTEGTDSRP